MLVIAKLVNSTFRRRPAMADDVADNSLSGTSDSDSESDNLKLKACPLHWQAPSFSARDRAFCAWA
jgi:hypothetical protein